MSNIIKPKLDLINYSKELNILLELIQPEVNIQWNNNENYYSNHSLFIGGSIGYMNGFLFEPDLDNALHELAHCIELPSKRITINGWGFKYGKLYNKGTPYECYEPQTPQHIEREIRVWAIQYRLYEYLHLTFTELVDSTLLLQTAQFLPGYHSFYKGRDLIKEVWEQIEIFTWEVVLTKLNEKKAYIKNYGNV